MVVDDQQLFRQGIIMLLNGYDNINVVAEAENGVETLKTLKLCDPDVILLDIDMPLMKGDEAAKFIRKDYPHIKIIVISMHDEPFYTLCLLKSGVHGYLAKNADIDVVVSAIQTVNSGGIFLEKATIVSLGITTDINEPINCIIGQTALDEEEKNLLKLICKGKTGKEIADILQIVPSIFNKRKSILKEKTGCKTDVDFVFYAFRHGIVKNDGSSEF